jgi:phosphoribosylformimino-5-aminoimidazole carboxamide ribotide isomerase
MKTFRLGVRMRVIPVLDVKAGQAVHAVAGHRDNYRPVQSLLHEGSDPLGLALAFRDRLGLCELYVADLDAILGGPPALGFYADLVKIGFRLWVDSGIRSAQSVTPLVELGIAKVVIGLETIRGPEELVNIRTYLETPTGLNVDRLAFSLDLIHGSPLLAAGSDWNDHDAQSIARLAVEEAGFRHILLIDLADVGTSAGVKTTPLLRELRASYPGIEVVVGGGLDGSNDLRILAAAGADAVLVASSLHSGRLRRDDLEEARLRKPDWSIGRTAVD